MAKLSRILLYASLMTLATPANAQAINHNELLYKDSFNPKVHYSGAMPIPKEDYPLKDALFKQPFLRTADYEVAGPKYAGRTSPPSKRP
ncbi:MAG: hypothetical protein ACQESF_03790 [Nanobdellota archaeon]